MKTILIIGDYTAIHQRFQDDGHAVVGADSPDDALPLLSKKVDLVVAPQWASADVCETLRRLGLRPTLAFIGAEEGIKDSHASGSGFPTVLHFGTTVEPKHVADLCYVSILN